MASQKKTNKDKEPEKDKETLKAELHAKEHELAKCESKKNEYQEEEKAERREKLHYKEEKLYYQKWLQAVTVLFVIVSIIFTITAIGDSDNIDVDDTLAPHVCEKNNMSLVHADFERASLENNNTFTLNIVCADKNKQLNENYLFTLNSRGK